MDLNILSSSFEWANYCLNQGTNKQTYIQDLGENQILFVLFG